MEPKDGDPLRDAEAIPSFLGHGKTSARDCSLFERLVLPIPTEAKQTAAGTDVSILVLVDDGRRQRFSQATFLRRGRFNPCSCG